MAPRKLNPIAHYLFALAATVFLYTMYARFVVPVVEGPPVVVRRQEPIPVVEETNQSIDKTWLASLVPAESWELEPCKVLLTPQGTILFKQWQRVDDEGTYSLYPFTMVMNDPESDMTKVEKSQRDLPVVVRSIDGATLKFSGPLTLGSQEEKAEMRSARLAGEVTIYRPETADGSQPDLRVLTRNVQIDQNRIFTLADVEFAYGDHVGSGRNLSMDLSHETDGNESAASFSTINGVRQMELAFVRKLVLRPQGTNDLALNRKPAAAVGVAAAFSSMTSPLELSCDGPFLFEFESRVATFHDNVHVRQQDAFGDNIHCKKLEIEFGEPAEPGVELVQPTEVVQQTGGESNLEVRSIIALGDGADQPAVITSHSRQTRVTGHRVSLDVATGLIDAGGAGDDVTVISEQFSFRAPTLRYELTDDSSLGELAAGGPGLLQRKSTDGKRAFTSRWKNKMTVTSEDELRKRITLDGDAFVMMGPDMSIASNELDFLVWQMPDPQAMLAGASDDGQPAGQKWHYLPSQLVTDGDVKIQTPRIQGTARNFVANWPKPVLKDPLANQTARVDRHYVRRMPQDDSMIASSPEFNAGSPTSDGFRPVPRSRTGPWTNVDVNDAPKPNDAAGKVLTERGLMVFDGDRVVANLHGDLDQPKVTDLSVDGSMRLVEQAPASVGGPDQLVIEGDNLRMVPQADQLYRVFVGGTSTHPASIQTPGLSLDGVSLNLDQANNKMWVEGAGQMAINPSQRPDTENVVNVSTGQTDPAGKIESVEIAWTGGMIFDGSRLYFEREIIMDADRKPTTDGQATVKTLSQSLTVTLDEKVQFSEMSRDGDVGEISIASMVMSNNLDAANRAFASEQQTSDDPVIVVSETRDTRGNLVEMQKLLSPLATVNALDGSVVAKGPGKVLNYLRDDGKGESKLSGFSQSFRRPSSQPNAPEKDRKPGIDGIHVNFDGELNANADRKEMLISGNVRAAYARVESYETIVEPDDKNTHPAGTVVLKCDRLQSAQWTPVGQESINEMVATGNAHITSQLFEATAQRLTYNDKTDMMIVSGSSRGNANLWFRPDPEAKLSHLTARKIMYRLADQWTNVEGVQSLELMQRSAARPK